MQLNAVIFDMDGVLIDSEPFWEKSGNEVLQQFGVILTHEQYLTTTGLRTREWIEWWFTRYNIDLKNAAEAERYIETTTIAKIKEHGKPMEGVEYILKFFQERNFILGLATSSPIPLIDVVIEKLGIKNLLKAYTSAEELTSGKPHPQVYLDCAEKLEVSPIQCICFEDSFNGMISAKAARMKCIVIPPKQQYDLLHWEAADLKIKSFLDFHEGLLSELGNGSI